VPRNADAEASDAADAADGLLDVVPDPGVQSVLVVGADRMMVDLCCTVLEHSGFLVHSVGTSRAAIEEVERAPYDLVVLTNSWLGGLNTLSIFMRITFDFGDTLPIVLLTAAPPESSVFGNMSASTALTWHLQKPFTCATLVRTARSAARAGWLRRLLRLMDA
jgi:DNA-binding response OmpR family regulator